MKKSNFIRFICAVTATAALFLSACSNEDVSETTAESTSAEDESSLEDLAQTTTGTEHIDVGGYDSPSPDATTTTTKAPDSITDVQNSNYSKGLAYISLGNGTCSVSGMGSCTDTCVVIPRTNPSGEIVVSITRFKPKPQF